MNENEYNEYQKNIIQMIESLGYERTKYNDPKFLPKTYRKNRNAGFQIIPDSRVHIVLGDWNDHFNFAPIFVNIYSCGKSVCIGYDISQPEYDIIAIVKGEIAVDDFIDSVFKRSGL